MQEVYCKTADRNASAGEGVQQRSRMWGCMEMLSITTARWTFKYENPNEIRFCGFNQSLKRLDSEGLCWNPHCISHLGVAKVIVIYYFGPKMPELYFILANSRVKKGEPIPVYYHPLNLLVCHTIGKRYLAAVILRFQDLQRSAQYEFNTNRHTTSPALHGLTAVFREQTTFITMRSITLNESQWALWSGFETAVWNTW